MPAQFDTLERVIDRVRGMLHQFAAGIYPDEAPLDAGALQDLIAVVRAHSALHDDVQAGVCIASGSSRRGAGRRGAGACHVRDRRARGSRSPTSAVGSTAACRSREEVSRRAGSAEAGAAFANAGLSRGQKKTPTADADPALDSEAEQPAASRLRDELDAELLEVFLTEAAELLPSVRPTCAGWRANPNDGELARDLMRKLHTVKGSARMAGAMRLGEAGARDGDADRGCDAARRRAADHHRRSAVAIRPGDGAVRRAAESGGRQRAAAVRRRLPPPQSTTSRARAPVIDIAAARADSKAEARAERKPAVVSPLSAIGGEVSATMTPAAPGAQQAATFIRVRSDVLDKLVDQAGEVSIARSKLENEVGTIKGSLTDLTENISGAARAVARGRDPGRCADPGARRQAVDANRPISIRSNSTATRVCRS